MTALDRPITKKPPMELCTDAEELYDWISTHLDIEIPRQNVCAHHDAPWEYIKHTYFEPSKDVIVCAPRGGGKTRLGAVATLLDMLHKPGCNVRILGGSLEQSRRMWEHLLPDVRKVAEDLLDDRRGLAEKILLSNGSSAAVLPQSQRAVRGLRVQKLRCDEVEMFDPNVWEAAQLITKSIDCPGWKAGVSGTVEAISTLHKPYGLMNRLVENARENGTKIIRWCLLEVLEKCPPERVCETCPLWDDCGGRAKTQCTGFMRIEDAIAFKRRVSIETWDAEMMCRRPQASGCVFPRFDPVVHVREDVSLRTDATMSLAVDFGFHAPFVCLWIRDDGQVCHVVDEYLQSGQAVHVHVNQIESRRWGRAERICCDPAGGATNEQTAESNVQYLKRRGYKVHTRQSLIIDGIEMIRAALHPAAEEVKLFIDPRCKKLIEAMRKYHYPDGGGELPHKDGESDHPIDALRYFYVNRFRKSARPGGRAY